MGNDFGSRLKEAREKKGLTLENTAALSGIKYKDLVKYENNLSLPKANKFIILLKLYQASADYLMELI